MAPGQLHFGPRVCGDPARALERASLAPAPAHRIGVGLDAENLATLHLEHPFIDETVDVTSRLEAGVERNPGFGPEQTPVELGADEGVKARVANLEEAPDEASVGSDELISQVEDGSSGHTYSLRRAGRTVSTKLRVVQCVEVGIAGLRHGTATGLVVPSASEEDKAGAGCAQHGQSAASVLSSGLHRGSP